MTEAPDPVRQIRQNANDVMDIDELLAGIEAQQADHGERLATVGTDVADLKSDVAELRSTVAEHSTILAEHSATLAEHGGKLDRILELLEAR